MPFINGRFYINPAYGRALERARRADGVWSEQFPGFAEPSVREQNFWNDGSPSEAQHPSPGAHWVTIDGHHVLVHETPTGQDRRQNHGQPTHSMQVQNVRNEKKAEVGYGETAGIVPTRSAGSLNDASPYARSTWDPASTNDLQTARRNIMDISERNSIVKRAKPDDPNNKIQQSVWQDNLSVAKKSRGDLPGKYFFIRQEGKGLQNPPKSAGFGQGRPIREYGPFRNAGGGDVPRGDKTFIDIYDK